jgi:leucyl-tRNA synthetase
MYKYNHKVIEAKWQKEWRRSGIYKTPEVIGGSKKYILDMFPYPSGATMHVGHLEGYIGTDIISRYLRMRGNSVLHPMGWDAFGLPAENYAIKTGIHPDKSTHLNIKTFKRQLINSGLSYDWDREIDTSDPEFYKWTQWLFILMFKRGLAYKKKAPVNWCPKDETVLANEQVIDGKCERCDTKIVQKELPQWFLKITAYADRLISGLRDLDWPDNVKLQQINWIGRSEGMIIRFKIQDSDAKTVDVFTTRPDTLNGVTFIAVAPNHPILDKKYQYDIETKDKIGEFTGIYAINPLTGKSIPIWVSNYVEMSYGTGAIMGVPAHDDRDMDFAIKYHLDVLKVDPDESLWDRIEKNKWGERSIKYHLRDWLISRQRYWGAPIPMLFCQSCGWQPVSEDDLPVVLPKDVDFLPHGESPIARSKTFQKDAYCPNCGKEARREVDTMDTYVDSSWYFIRFVDPANKRQFAEQKLIKKWLPVDIYVGGGHVVQHLLFARFFWKVLFDEGLIDKSLGDEPFLRLLAPGWILGPDSRKMSKRWGNVVTPDDIIPKFGADVLRLYEMFMGPFDVVKPWNITGVEGMRRFILRIWDLFSNYHVLGESARKKHNDSISAMTHKTIKRVTNDIERFHYNTAISAVMEFVNFLNDQVKSVKSGDLTFSSIPRARGGLPLGSLDFALKTLCQLIAPFAPHIAEEIWVNVLGQPFSIHGSGWPEYDENLTKDVENTIVITVNGKPRSKISKCDNAISKDEIIRLAKEDQKIKKWIEGKKIKNVIYVPGRLLNFVI